MKTLGGSTDWTMIVGQYGRLVWKTAYRLLGSSADADDCYQETFISAFKFAKRQTVISWPGLLQRLATARALEILRGRNRGKFVEGEHERRLGEVISAEIDPASRAQNADMMELLLRAIASLPPLQAQVFCLRCLNELSYEEIAAGMGISVDAVGVNLHRARGILRQRFSHELSAKLELQI